MIRKHAFLFVIILMLVSPCLAVAADVQPEVLRDVPLPGDITFCPVSPTDPPAAKELIGVWRGKWDNFGEQNTALVVKCIELASNPPKAKVSYGWGEYKGGGPPINSRGWEDWDAEYAPGDRPTITSRGRTRDVQFTLKNGKLIGWFYHAGSRSSNHCTLEKTGEVLPAWKDTPEK